MLTSYEAVFRVFQISTHRPSYINAILIQSYGTPRAADCVQCQNRGYRPFPVCHSLTGFWGDACGNCKWRDHAAQCSFHIPGNYRTRGRARAAAAPVPGPVLLLPPPIKVAGPVPKIAGPVPKAGGPAPKAGGPAPKAGGPAPKASGLAPKAAGPAPPEARICS